MQTINFKILFIIILTIIITPVACNAAVADFHYKHTISISDDSLRIIQLEYRVRQIQQMNLDNLSPLEKNNLRQELKQMLKEAKTYDKKAPPGMPRVYISLWALIIIILLLILILR
jgi:hypothetical protein